MLSIAKLFYNGIVNIKINTRRKFKMARKKISLIGGGQIGGVLAQLCASA